MMYRTSAVAANSHAHRINTQQAYKAGETAMSTFIRARSDAQKAERMADILAAAKAEFAEKPYAAITMSTVAERLGWTRTKLYKYVTTKEDIFLALCGQTRDEYFAALTAATPAGAALPHAQLAATWAEVLNTHRDYLRTTDILLTVIETNVDIDRLAAFKTDYFQKAGALQVHLAATLHTTPETANKLCQLITNQAAGLCGSCCENPLIQAAMQKANLPYSKPDFTANMREFIEMCLHHYAPRG